MSNAIQDEWLWGWDPTPDIVSVWAEADGRAMVWRRTPVSTSSASTVTRMSMEVRPT